jgi:protochlorophyllide reductase
MAKILALVLAAAVSTTSAFAPTLSNNAVSAVSKTNSFALEPTVRECMSLFANKKVLDQTDLPEKLYFEKAKEAPKVLGGIKIGKRKIVVVTGASSGLGRNCAATLAKTGRYFVVMAVRDVEKAKAVAKEEGMPDNSYVTMKLELGNLQSVRDFVQNLKAFKSARPLNHLICNAAVYRPTDPDPAWTDDGFEMSMVRNRLFLPCFS